MWRVETRYEAYEAVVFSRHHIMFWVDADLWRHWTNITDFQTNHKLKQIQDEVFLINCPLREFHTELVIYLLFIKAVTLVLHE